MLRAINAGYLDKLPRLTAKMFTSNYPNSPATAMGHLDQTRQRKRKSKAAKPPLEHDQSPEALDDELHYINAAHISVLSTEELASDAAGRFPFVSARGYQYMLVSVYRGFIFVALMRDRTAGEYVKALRETYAFLSKNGHKPELQTLDNESSSALTTFLKTEAKVKLNLVPPNTHRRNRAERAIRDWKNHFLSLLATIDRDFPMNQWDLLVPQAMLTINILRPCRSNIAISAHEGIYGSKYDFGAHPIHVAGMRIVALDPPDKRESWSPHGLDAFYISPSLDHYQSY